MPVTNVQKIDCHIWTKLLINSDDVKNLDLMGKNPDLVTLLMFLSM